MQRMASVAERLAVVRANVAKAAGASTVNSPQAPVRLVAVSKTKPLADIQEAYAAGQRHFGENVQELVDKAAQLPQDIQWHFIGGLQSNKCKLLAPIPNLFVVETIDSIKKADVMNKACAERPSPLNVFVQVNTSKEASKSGVDPAECVQVAEHIVKACPKLNLLGLMTIGAPDHDPSTGPNPDFVLLKQCQSDIQTKLGLSLELSMGMSDDYEHAIELGSTNVRVGSKIFGARSYPPKP